VPSLTDGEIRRALKQVEQTAKQLSLVDGEGHGTGRLVLVMKPMPTRVTADWMAQQWRDQKRLKRKLGSYPSMSLGNAREVFTRDFADMIQKGRSIKIAGDTRTGTLADLFEGYVAHLEASAKSSWEEAEKVLNRIADTLGRNRPARDIEPDEITDVIRPHLRSRQAFDGGSRPKLHPVGVQLGSEIGARLPWHVPTALPSCLQSSCRHSHGAQESRDPLA
jgi:hypothetical protein